MKLSQLFTKTLREPPKDEVSINAQLLTRAGFVRKVLSGVYAYLPLGWRVIEKIKNIIREEVNEVGGQELQFSSLQSKDLWDKSGRWELLGKKEKIMYQFQDHSSRDLGLASTHEEPITEVAKDFIQSYKDLPKAVYQFQKKFRDELRPKSGLVRLREFLMKDLYSFHADENDLQKYYEQVKGAYLKIFKRCGLQTMVVEASGGIFTKNVSHEFQVLDPFGEDKILYCPKCHWAQNQEISKLSEGDKCPSCKAEVSAGTGVEVGNIFNNGTKYSKDLGLYYKDKMGQNQLVWMGSYGIGLDRLMGVIVDLNHDQKGIIWPENLAPYRVHLVVLKGGERKAADAYEALLKRGLEILYDDRQDVSAGEKLADADLLGIPYKLVVSEKTEPGKVELKMRHEDRVLVVPVEQIMSR